MDLDTIINELNNIITNKYKNFKGIYLYGSRVKGQSREDSDIDIVLIFDSDLSKREELDLAGVISDISYKYSVWIDYHPYNIDTLKKNPFYYEEVVDKGVFYGRAA